MMRRLRLRLLTGILLLRLGLRLLRILGSGGLRFLGLGIGGMSASGLLGLMGLRFGNLIFTIRF